MAAYWPFQSDSNEMAAHLNATPEHVVSTMLFTPTWGRTVILDGGDLRAGIGELKSAGEGDVVILGSGVLVRHLLREQLLDGLRLFIHPLVLGSGKRLFGDLPLPQALTLTGCDTTPAGSVCLSYEIPAP